MKKLFLLLTAMAMFVIASAQNRTVTGQVVYAGDGEPLVGATVVPVGAGQGAATDIDGNFTLSVPSSVTKLKVSYVGMHTREVAITGEKLIIKLSNADNKLDEVIVTAYGTAKKSAYTGSAAQVDAAEIEGRMVTNAINALKGEAAGVQIISNNGQPGSSPSVYIRGVGSLNASTAPLYVVDGMPFDGDIASLNTMDFESITVLKDAASAALYGARGANGVILITTKKGKEGQAKVTFDARWGGNSRQIPNYNVIKSPAQYTEMAYAALYNSYRGMDGYSDMMAHRQANNDLYSVFGDGYQIYTVPNAQALVGTNGKLNPNATLGYSNGTNYFTPDDWEKGTMKSGFRQEYNLSVSGGTDRYDYYVSAGYLGDEGLVEGSDYKRLSTRAAFNYQAKSWMKIGTNVSYNYVRSGWPDSQTSSDYNSSMNAFAVANNIAPIYPMFVRDASGKLMYDTMTGHPVYDYGDGQQTDATRNYLSGANPASDLIYNTTEYLMDVLNAKAYATITPVERLNITGTIGYFLDNTRSHEINSTTYGQSAKFGGTAVQEFNRTRAINAQFLGTYSHSIADIHHLDYMVGYESYTQNSEMLYAHGQQLYNPNSWAISNTINNDTRKAVGSAGSYATRGWFGRVNYDYDGRYFFSGSYRRDASSRFAPDKRWGNFFSVSAAWDIAKESFMHDYEWVDMLKAKFSFGQQGNDGIGNNYAYLDQYSLLGTDSWSDGTLAYKGNPDITWETSNALNGGFDFSFLNGKVDGTVEYFQRQVSDMLYKKPVAPSNGYDFIPMNVGSMRNYGIDIELNYRPIATRDITWEIKFNGTWIRNKVLKLSPDLNGELISNSRIYREGESMYQYYLVEYAGVNQSNGDPMFYAKRVENEKSNADDMPADTPIGGEYKTKNYDVARATNRKTTGNTMPTFFGGFGTSLQCHGFDFAINFSYQLGGRVMDSGYGQFMHSGDTQSLGSNWHADMLNAWTPENTNTDIPRLDTTAPYSVGGSTSTFLLKSSNYLSLNNITVGYTFPTRLVRKLGLESLRIYGAADNVALWSKRKGLDPRNSFAGVMSNATYSAVRNISGGIRLVF